MSWRHSIPVWGRGGGGDSGAEEELHLLKRKEGRGMRKMVSQSVCGTELFVGTDVRESFKLVAVVGARTGDDGGNGSSSSSTSANLAIGGSEGQIEEIAAEGGNTCQKAATEPARGGEAGLKREKGHATGCVKSDRQ